MNKDYDIVEVSDGVLISSLSEVQKQSANYKIKPDIKENATSKVLVNHGASKNISTFQDLFEIESPEEVNTEKSDIDSIEFVKYDDFFPSLMTTLNQELENIDTVSKIPVKLDTINSSKVKNKYKLSNFKSVDTNDLTTDVKNEQLSSTDDIEEAINFNEIDNIDVGLISDIDTEENQSFEKLEAIDDEDVPTELDNQNIISKLMSNINDGHSEIDYPGKIELTDIDSTLLNKEIIKIAEDSKEEEHSESKMLGVERAEIFDTIDKEINTARKTTSFDINKIKNLKSGVLLPIMVVFVSFSALFLAVPGLYLYFQRSATSTLEDNVINDSSILAKIAKQKEEEARKAQLRLEEERRQLEQERNKIESKINEELLKKQQEIENQFKNKFTTLEQKGLSEEELRKLRAQLEEEKTNALAVAEKEREKKINEQQKILNEKNKELVDAEEKLKLAIANKEFEISNITKKMEDELKRKEKEREDVSKKLKELSETNIKIREFNDIIFQLTSGAIEEFRNNRIESGLLKLDSLLKYYNSRIEFVNNNPELKNKMQSDIFFVQSINRFINESKSASSYNKEFVDIINNFKKISEHYKSAENFYSQRNWRKSSDEYAKALAIFDEVNFSYKRMQDSEIQIQNIKAADYYNSAIENMKLQKYDLALTQLSNIVKETPLSNFTGQAVDSMVELSNTLSSSSVLEQKNAIESQNQGALKLTEAGDRSMQIKDYDSAIKSYSEVILDYPLSQFVKRSHTNLLIALQNKYDKEKSASFDSLQETFRKNYVRFKELNDRGNFKEARNYYFSALNTTFGKYADNSVEQFKKLEDEYIEKIIDENKGTDTASLSIQIEQTRKEVEDKYNKLLNQQKEDYEKKIADIRTLHQEELKKAIAEKNQIKEQYDKIIATSSSKEEIENIKKYYEKQLTDKNDEISALNKKFLSSTEYIEVLKKEMQNSIDTLQSEKKSLQDDYNKLLSDKTNTDSNINMYKNLISTKDNEIINYKKELENQTNSIVTLKKDYDTQIVNLKNEKDMLQRDFDKFKTESSSKLTNENEIRKIITDKDNEIERYKKELDKQTTSTENLKKEYEIRIATLSEEKTTLQKEYENLKKESGGNVVNEEQYKKSIAEKENEIEKLKREISNAGLKDSEIKKGYEEKITLLINDNQKLKDDYDKLLKQIQGDKESNTMFQNLITEKQNEIDTLKKDLSVSLSRYNNEKKELEQSIAKLTKEKDDIDKNYKVLLEKSKTGTDSNEEISNLKKNYETIIAEKDAEIKKMKEMTPEQFNDKIYKDEIARIEKDLQNEKLNSIKLKEQLVEAYKKYSELENKARLYDELSSKNYRAELEDLQKKYKELEKAFNSYKKTEPDRITELEKKYNELYEKKLNEEKQKILNNFNSEIDRLNKMIAINEKIEKERKLIDSNKTITDTRNKDISTDKEKIIIKSNMDMTNKFIARTVDKIGNSITFQFFTTSYISSLVRGDKVIISRIIRTTINGVDVQKETIVGDAEIIHTDLNSLFGRATIIKTEKNFEVEVNDLLKKK